MFIQTEQTPNPATLKFLPGQTVMAAGKTAEFVSADGTGPSPLAKRLFEIEGVVRVFFSGDYVSVTKDEGVEWETLKTHILAEIMQHFTSGLPVMDEVLVSEAEDEEDDELVKQIKELLDTRVRPAVAQDGGDITFVKFEDGIVYLKMQGACSGCPSAAMTLKGGIENMLQHFVPEVVEVRPVD